MRPASLAWILIFGFQSYGQTASNLALSGYPYPLRMQRWTSGTDACLLLQQTGDYHYERTSGDATAVFEGVLSPQELSEIRERIEVEELRNLAQKDIPVSLMTIGQNQLQLDVFRGDHWQDLFFRDGESQKPFAKSLLPLVKWFEALPKVPHRELSEDEGKNNCLPPKKIELSSRPPSPAPAGVDEQVSSVIAPDPAPKASGSTLTTTAPIPPQNPFIMGFESEEISASGAHVQCVVIYSDGRYHMEKSWQKPKSQVSSEVYEGSITVAEIQNLQHLLDDPILTKLEQTNLNDARLMIRGSITILTIPRNGNHTQHLLFGDDLRAMGGPGTSFPVDGTNTRLIRPIEKWVKMEVFSTKTALPQGGTPTRCSPK